VGASILVFHRKLSSPQAFFTASFLHRKLSSPQAFFTAI